MAKPHSSKLDADQKAALLAKLAEPREEIADADLSTEEAALEQRIAALRPKPVKKMRRLLPLLGLAASLAAIAFMPRHLPRFIAKGLPSAQWRCDFTLRSTDGNAMVEDDTYLIRGGPLFILGACENKGFLHLRLSSAKGLAEVFNIPVTATKGILLRRGQPADLEPYGAFHLIQMTVTEDEIEDDGAEPDKVWDASYKVNWQ